jgi:hypothetical protein
VALGRREHQPHGQPALQDRGSLHRTQVGVSSRDEDIYTILSFHDEIH